MKNRWQLLTVLLLGTLIGVGGARAEVLPGNPCSVLNAVAPTGGPQNLDQHHLLVCDGSNWQIVLDWDRTSGRSLFQVNDDSANPCTAAKEGRISYTGSAWEYCDGSDWAAFSGGGGGEFRGALLVQASNQTISQSTYTYANLGHLSYDEGGFWSASQPNRLTVPAGISYVMVCAHVDYTNWSSTTWYEVDIIRNNGEYGYAGNALITLTGGPASQTCTAPLQANTGDYFRLEVYNENSSSTYRRIEATTTWLSIHEMK